jgi:hypothetical protein
MVRGWKQILLLLTLERVIEGGTTYNLIVGIMNATHHHGGESNQNIEEGLITFEAMGFYILRCEIGCYRTIDEQMHIFHGGSPLHGT